MNNNPIVLQTAFAWDCPKCGYQNFVKGLPVDSSDEEVEEALREINGIEEWEEVPSDLGGEFVMAPERVICDECENEYSVFSEDFEDDDEE